jgi:hypothetical protein
MEVRFQAAETVSLRVEEEKIPIQHYLRQPGRLVQAIAEPSLMEQLSDTHFRLKMRPLSFLDLYHFQPMVILKVWSSANGIVYLHSEDCEIKGIDYINQRFSLNVTGKLAPEDKQGQTYLVGKANLEVKVALPPPLWLTPTPILEVAANGLLKGVLARIKQRLLSQLLKDYYQWVKLTEEVELTYPSNAEDNNLGLINVIR